MRKKSKPQPFKWSITDHGIVEHYRFSELVKSNPPPKDYDTPVIAFGRVTERGVWVM
jgi:hypothetical protein